MSETATATPAASPTTPAQETTAGTFVPPATATVLAPSTAGMARRHEVARVLRDVAATCATCAGHVALKDGQIDCGLPVQDEDKHYLPECTVLRLASRVEDPSAPCTEVDSLCTAASPEWIAQHAYTVVPLPESAKKNEQEGGTN